MRYKNYIFKVNAWIAGLWFLMPAILYPLNALKIPPFTSAIVSILFLISIVLNRFRFNKVMLLFVCVYLLLIGAQMVFYPETVIDFNSNRDVWLSTIVFGIMSISLAATSYDSEYLVKTMNKMAIPTVIVILLCVCNDSFLNQIRTLDGWYMHLGFSLMLPLAVMAVYLITHGIIHNKIEVLIYIFGVITLLMYGNRGAWMCHGVVYLLMFFYCGYKNSRIKSFVLYLFILCMFIIAFYEIIVEKCLELVVDIFDDFIPYAWMHLISLYIDGDWGEFSAGRNEIWTYALDSLSENIFWGNYVGFIHKVSSSTHNIFLEILCDYGVFVFLIFVLFLIYRVYVYIKYRPMENIPLLIIFISCACEQLTSGYMFFQNNFMFFLGLLMTEKITMEKAGEYGTTERIMEVHKER